MAKPKDCSGDCCHAKLLAELQKLCTLMRVSLPHESGGKLYTIPSEPGGGAPVAVPGRCASPTCWCVTV